MTVNAEVKKYGDVDVYMQVKYDIVCVPGYGGNQDRGSHREMTSRDSQKQG
jgi:hypothetical protein